MNDLLTSPKPGREWSLRAAGRRTFIRAVATTMVLAAGVVTVRGLESALNAFFDKPPASLQKEFKALSRRLGNPVHYEATKPDQVLDPAIVEALGTNDYLVREYRDLTLAEGVPGEFINLNLNFYPTGSSTPHVPENCWAGSGREEAAGSREVFEIPGVRRRDGSTITLHVKLISFVPDARGDAVQLAGNSGREPLYTNVAYLFHVNGDYVANPQEVTSRFWKASYRYAYHAKIELTPMIRIHGGVTPLLATHSQAKQIVSDFLKEALPEIEECLPDPAILTAPEPPAAGHNTR